MKSLTITDKETGELIEEREFSGGYNIVYTNLDDNGYLRHINKLDNGKYDSDHWIKSYLYRPIAAKLIKKFEELRHIVPGTILFIEDTEWKPGSEDRPWIAKTSKANKQLQAMAGYGFVIETREWYTEKMSREQITALLYHELKHIDTDGSILKHDIEDWECMVATLGMNWATTKANIPDILDDDFDDWDELRRAGTQISIFDKKVLVGGK